MKKHRLYVIRKQGDLFHRISIRFHRDAVTREWSVSLSGFGHVFMICITQSIPELYGTVRFFGRFPRQFPHETLSKKKISQR